ncbi:MAG: chorismate synthase [Candidatus Atribacteria bacterium]|nr:chorismate synthase [Candidatus Atribacteria bacterium]
MIYYETAGESHGIGITTVISGFPSQLPVDVNFIQNELARRQKGYGSGPRMKMEKDTVEFLGGVRWQKTLGSPIAVLVRNRDSVNWKIQMDPLGDPPPDYHEVTVPRPGHADLSGTVKYQFTDIRNVIERASARETVGRCVAGSFAKMFLSQLGIVIGGYVESIGGITASIEMSLEEKIKEALNSELATFDQEAAKKMTEAIDQAREKGDSLGGTFVVVALGMLPGFGDYNLATKRLDAQLAERLMSIPSVKGVEIGDGFLSTRLLGSEVHDAIYYDEDRKPFAFIRSTNRAGGIEGGVSNGEPIIVRCAMKPIPTLQKGLSSVDIVEKSKIMARYERSDVCAVPRGLVVGEAMMAWVIASAVREKFGGDSLKEVIENYQNYLNYLEDFSKKKTK